MGLPLEQPKATPGPQDKWIWLRNKTNWCMKYEKIIHIQNEIPTEDREGCTLYELLKMN